MLPPVRGRSLPNSAPGVSAHGARMASGSRSTPSSARRMICSLAVLCHLVAVALVAECHTGILATRLQASGTCARKRSWLCLQQCAEGAQRIAVLVSLGHSPSSSGSSCLVMSVAPVGAASRAKAQPTSQSCNRHRTGAHPGPAQPTTPLRHRVAPLSLLPRYRAQRWPDCARPDCAPGFPAN